MGLIGSLILMNADASIDEDWNRSGTRTYIAAFTLDCDEVYARTHCGLVINTPHPSDNGSVIVNIQTSLEPAEPSSYQNPLNPTDSNNGTACYWYKVTVTFGPWDPLQHSATGSPVDVPLQPSFDWQIGEQICDVAYDSNGNLVPVLTSAGIPFDPPVTEDELRGIFRIAYNSLSFSPATYFAYGNLLNNDTFWGFAPYTLKYVPPKMPQRLYSHYLGQNYYRLEVEIHFNPNVGGWLEKPIDRGYIAKDTNGNLYKILDSKGQPYPEPSLLDGSGHVLTNPSNYQVLTFQTYNSISFSNTFGNLANLFS